MEGFWNLFSNIPWYAWIALVAIICGTIVRVSNNRARQRQSEQNRPPM
jgi:hypothetical protein